MILFNAGGFGGCSPPGSKKEEIKERGRKEKRREGRGKEGRGGERNDRKQMDGDRRRPARTQICTQSSTAVLPVECYLLN